MEFRIGLHHSHFVRNHNHALQISDYERNIIFSVKQGTENGD